MQILSIFSGEYQGVPPVNHQQKRFMNGIGSIFDMTSTYFCPMIHIKVKSFEKLDKWVIKYKNQSIKGYIATTKSWGGGIFEVDNNFRLFSSTKIVWSFTNVYSCIYSRCTI